MDYIFTCQHCGIKVTKTYVKPSWITKGRAPKFCSPLCAHLASRRRIEVTCDWCGTIFERALNKAERSKFNFCSRTCKEHAQSIDGGEKFSEMRPSHYGGGSSGYRKRALDHYGAECTECGYNENEDAIQVHHIDGDRQNGSLDNLQVVCANCHAIKTARGCSSTG